MKENVLRLVSLLICVVVGFVMGFRLYHKLLIDYLNSGELKKRMKYRMNHLYNYYKGES